VLLERHAEGSAEDLYGWTEPNARWPTATPHYCTSISTTVNPSNDFGHTVGDGVLVEFSRRLRESCRPSDVPAQLAGDEFAILMAEPLTAEQALTVADRVVRAAVVPFLIADKVITIGARVGIATVDNSGQPAPPLEV